MEFENPISDEGLHSDIITTLPKNIIESILSLIPLRDAVRTSILSKKWRYSWRSMPKLAFTNKLVRVPSYSGCKLLNCKLAGAIFNVLLLHDGPGILEFNCHLHKESEFLQIMGYLARWNKLKELIFCNDIVNRLYKVPVSFFSLQGLERIDLQNCTFDPPLTCNVFSRLKSITFRNVEVSAQILQRFLSKCPPLECLYLGHDVRSEVDLVAGNEFAPIAGGNEFMPLAGGNKFTFVDLLRCMPKIQSLVISSYYMRDLSAGGMPHNLPTKVFLLKNLTLVVRLMEQSEISSALCVISSAPMLENIEFMVGQKRGKLLINLEEDEQPKKKARVGSLASQWVSVYNARPPTKQRYHYDVADSRLSQHVENGKKDGFYISCVASALNRWALVMDAGTGFSSQVYNLSPFFLNKDWIMEQWGNDYYITSIAGAANGSSLVVMSKGTPYKQQSYKVSESFPFQWISKKWREGFRVTSITTAGSRWGVVMSRNSGFVYQVVELDFLYPSERIQCRWENKYRMTSMAATPDQAAYILSTPNSILTDETQETLITSSFPSTHVEENWSKNLYIASICYGRTVV
ncbi:uncharacterized protein LOC143553802 isoform X5 [Bidens hawaiensis]|uniref:uncharacterized protein LOC143553802 isoform X5 n=1 Tax=Bidens hawaiensis TaxID=980011 RepID=UPI00404B690E